MRIGDFSDPTHRTAPQSHHATVHTRFKALYPDVHVCSAIILLGTYTRQTVDIPQCIVPVSTFRGIYRPINQDNGPPLPLATYAIEGERLPPYT